MRQKALVLVGAIGALAGGACAQSAAVDAAARAHTAAADDAALDALAAEGRRGRQASPGSTSGFSSQQTPTPSRPAQSKPLSSTSALQNAAPGAIEVGGNAAQARPPATLPMQPTAAALSPNDATRAPKPAPDGAVVDDAGGIWSFSVQRGERLSEALATFVKRHGWDLEWTTTTDFVVQRAYTVQADQPDFARMLTRLLEPYRLSARLHDAPPQHLINVFASEPVPALKKEASR